MGILGGLNREQKEAVGLLQIGTFLEYFDLMLYVHMAVLLNELFFPQTDPHTASLLAAFAFCSTYVLRPFGALLFGYIGDNIGRKTTVIITTMMMSISCLIMAILPTYAQIGITASWAITLCRMIQGLSSMSEMIGAQIYVTEITKPPVQYPAVTFIGIAAGVGGSFALFIAFLVTSIGLNWRAAFWLGSAIAAIGTVARTKLRETPEFVDMKRRKKKEIEEAEIDDATRALKLSQIKKLIKREEINKQTLAACFSVYCGWPVTFYLAFMYFNPILKGVYGYSSENIIFHNFLLSLILVVYGLFTAALSYKTPPLKIMKIRAGLFLILALLLPTLITYTYRWSHIFFLQVTLLILNLGDLPGEAILIKHFPIFKRFTATSFLYALTRAIMYVVTSFGLVFLTGVGLYGLWIILLPITLGFLWGIRHFEKLEGLRPSKPSKVTNDRVRSHAA